MKSALLNMSIIVSLCFSWINSNAEMPKTPCESICPHAPAGGHCVQMGKNRIYYRTLGSGKPTIVFSSGTGFPADDWFNTGIATAMAKKVKVFAYDRTYTFNSCPAQNDYMPLTAKDVVSQLHELLRQEGVLPPYILVGHSIGGLYMLLYATEFPDEVVGIVLMDATSDEGPTPFTEIAKSFLKKIGNPQNPSPDNQLYNEIIGQLPSYLQMKNALPLKKDIPLIVMYATKHCLPASWTKELMCMTPQEEANHVKQQINMYNISKNHKLIKVSGDHMIFFDASQNANVIDALNSIIKMSDESRGQAAGESRAPSASS